MSDSNTSKNNSEENTLKKKLHFLEKVANFNPNLLYIIQLNPHKIVYINTVIKNLLGLDPNFMIEKGPEIFQSLIFPDDYARWLKNLESCFTGEEEKPCEVEIRVRTKEEGWKWFKIKDKIFEWDSTGKVTHVIGTAYDIHEQKIWEEKLKEEHRRFQNAQEIGHIGSFQRKLPGEYLSYSPEFSAYWAWNQKMRKYILTNLYHTYTRTIVKNIQKLYNKPILPGFRWILLQGQYGQMAA